MSWQPSASIEALRQRAQFLRAIREFFAQRDVMEVDTPLLSRSTVTDPLLASFEVQGRYLQTSPEYAMKRLLSAGAGAIYYLGKAFRREEAGRWHNPEFTMLEWYRPGWDHHALIQEVALLFEQLLGCGAPSIVTYADLFQHYFDLQPHTASIAQLQAVALSQDWLSSTSIPDMDKEGWLDLIMSHGIEPFLGQSSPTVVTDFPASQASLAKKRMIIGDISYEVAERFEFYYQGAELANGYHELGCAQELRLRFEEDLAKRQALGLEILPIDHDLLSALEAGFPVCAGVAVGVDRLLMLQQKATHIDQVLPFVWERA